MKKSMAPIVIGVIVLICLVVGLNAWQGRTSAGGDEDSDQSSQQTQSKQTASSTQTAPPKLSGDLVLTLLPEETIGDPATAKTKVTIGYTFDSATQADPTKAARIISVIQDWAKSQGNKASLQVVCVDLPADQLTNPADAQVKLGISINGSQPAGFNVNPGEGSYTKQEVFHDLGAP